MDFYAGLDVSLEATNICVVDGDGKVVREAKLETDPDAIELFLAEWGIPLKRVGLEAFSYSARLFTALAEKGLPVICIETRHAKAALNAMLNKTDRNDAKGIAQMSGPAGSARCTSSRKARKRCARCWSGARRCSARCWTWRT